MINMGDTMKEAIDRFFNNTGWDNVAENEKKDKAEWGKLMLLDPYKSYFRRAINDNKFDTDSIEGFDVVVNAVAEQMRYIESSRWIRQQKAARCKFKPPEPPAPGLIFMGQPGTGKTMLAGIIQQLTGICLYRIQDIAQTYQIKGFEGVRREYPAIYYGDVILDDFGIQEERKHYGQGGVIEEIIHQRYDLWKKTRKLTIITTNYVSLHDIDKLGIRGMCNDYSNQTITRIEEMYYPIMFQGDCKRTPAYIKFKSYNSQKYQG